MFEKIINSTQEQATAAWIDNLSVLRAETLIEKLSTQDGNLENALDALNVIKEFVNSPKHILGSNLTKHGEVAEQMQVGFSNAEAAVQGKPPIYSFNGVGRLAMEDYLRNGKMVQSKFHNGVRGTFQAVCLHAKQYPKFIENGGSYDIPRDQYTKLIDIYNRGETLRSSLSRSEETLYLDMKNWEANNTTNIKEAIRPAKIGYDDVQLGVAEKTISNEEKRIQKIDKEIRDAASKESAASFSEGMKATTLAAILEGGISLLIKIYQKKKSGVKIQNFTRKDWEEIGIETLIGTGKGATRGAIVYLTTNFTTTPAPLANALITATFGVTAQARKLKKGIITPEDFIDNCEVICLDVAVSALFSMLGNVLIPIPVLGAIIGNATGMFMHEIAKNYLSQMEQRIIASYKNACEEFIESLDIEYLEKVNRFNEELEQFGSLIEMVFDQDANKRFNASIELALSSGVEPEKVIKSREERDAFFGG